MQTTILSILICSIKNREQKLTRLLKNIGEQGKLFYIEKLNNDTDKYELQLDNCTIEILINKNERNSIGAKRNDLLQMATGEYVCNVDDDDVLAPNYAKSITDAIANSKADCITFDLAFFNKDKFELVWNMSIKNESTRRSGGVTKMYATHLCAFKTKHVKNVPYNNTSSAEDVSWVKLVKNSKRIKTEYHIDDVLYFYLYDKSQINSSETGIVANVFDSGVYSDDELLHKILGLYNTSSKRGLSINLIVPEDSNRNNLFYGKLYSICQNVHILRSFNVVASYIDLLADTKTSDKIVNVFLSDNFVTTQYLWDNTIKKMETTYNKGIISINDGIHNTTQNQFLVIYNSLNRDIAEYLTSSALHMNYSSMVVLNKDIFTRSTMLKNALYLSTSLFSVNSKIDNKQKDIDEYNSRLDKNFGLAEGNYVHRPQYASIELNGFFERVDSMNKNQERVIILFRNNKIYDSVTDGPVHNAVYFNDNKTKVTIGNITYDCDRLSIKSQI